VWKWHLGIWFSRHGGVGRLAGLDDLRGLFQPMILCGEDAQDKESCRPGGSVMTRLSVGPNEQISGELQHSCVRLYKINGIFLRNQLRHCCHL